MFCAIGPILIFTTGLQCPIMSFGWIKCMCVTQPSFFSDNVESNATNSRSCPREVFVDEITAQADCFENLRPAITLGGGDPHLRNDFDYTFVDCFNVVLNCRFQLDALHHADLAHVLNGFKSQVRIYCGSSVTK